MSGQQAAGGIDKPALIVSLVAAAITLAILGASLWLGGL